MTKKLDLKIIPQNTKKIISISYGFTAFMVALLGYAIKNNKRLDPAIFGSSIAISTTTFAHVLAKKEARERLHKEKERN